LNTWSWSLSEELFALTVLAIDGQNTHVLGLGDAGDGSVFEISSSAEIVDQFSISSDLETALRQSNASVTHLAHGPAGGGANMLFVGTDRGLLAGETTTARDEFEANWRFFYTPETTPFPTAIDELRSLSLGMVANPAEVRTMILDGPNAANAQVLWFGTPSGVHMLNLVDNSISHSGLLEHPGVEGRYVREYNNIHSLHTTGDEVLVGSVKGMWAISGDYSAVYGFQEQETIYGEIVTIQSLLIDGNTTVLTGSSPGQYANLELINPGANDSDNDGMPDGWEVANGLDPTVDWY
jgi:hypothetical protein